MHIPFVRKSEALTLLEDAYHAEEARGEFLAEQGSSYFYGGMTAADASWAALNDMRQMEDDFRSSAEGQEYLAKLAAARLYEGLPVLSEYSIPEFVENRPSYAHSPFAPALSRFQTSPDPNDIPF